MRFRRTVWTNTDDEKEFNDCTLWVGPAATVRGFSMSMRFDSVALGPIQVTPRAHVSSDGKSWSAVTWLGSNPESFGSDGFKVAFKHLGPFLIAPDHGRTLMRITLLAETPAPGSSGAALRVAEVQGVLNLLPAE